MDWFDSASKERFHLDVSFTHFQHGKEIKPFSESATTAVFDPQVDFMYVGENEFKTYVKTVLEFIYKEKIKCSDNECWFPNVDSCKDVAKEDMILKM